MHEWAIANASRIIVFEHMGSKGHVRILVRTTCTKAPDTAKLGKTHASETLFVNRVFMRMTYK
jgi:hypothetical protein